MNEICVIGVSWRHGTSETLAPYTLPVEDRAERVARLTEEVGARELVYLATCNRVEVTLCSDGSTELGDYRCRVHRALTGRSSLLEATRRLRGWAGEGAVEHLFLVAAGLDSAQLGEHEIPGQMRQAVDLAREAGVIGRRLDWLFGEALRVARSVRSESRLSTGHLSLSEIALERLLDHLETLPVRGPVALVGVSPMTERCAARLHADGVPLVIVNRRPERARELAERTGAKVRSLDEFQRDPDAVVALVSATAAPEPILGRSVLERLAGRAPGGEGPLLIDMAVPPDIDPDAARKVGLPRLGMDEINAQAQRNRQLRMVEAASARQIVDEALDKLRREMAHRDLAPVLAGLNKRYRETARVGIDRLFRKELAGVDEKGRKAIRRWSETLAKRLAHVPVMGLRALAAEDGMPAVRTFLEASDDPAMLELANALETVDDGYLGDGK